MDYMDLVYGVCSLRRKTWVYVVLHEQSFTFIFHTPQFGKEQGSSEARIWLFDFRYS